MRAKLIRWICKFSVKYRLSHITFKTRFESGGRRRAVFEISNNLIVRLSDNWQLFELFEQYDTIQSDFSSEQLPNDWSINCSQNLNQLSKLLWKIFFLFYILHHFFQKIFSVMICATSSSSCCLSRKFVQRKMAL